jgi:hypothetical protein
MIRTGMEASCFSEAEEPMQDAGLAPLFRGSNEGSFLATPAKLLMILAAA